jgi:hypothetical protein
MVYQGNYRSPVIGAGLNLLMRDNNNHVMSLAVPGSMMSHLATVLSSGRVALRAWPAAAVLPQRTRRLEEVRRAMLEALEGGGVGGHAALRRRVLFATEAQQLWYLRTELMAAVSAACGESRAREVLQSITPHFRELVPAALFASAMHAHAHRA